MKIGSIFEDELAQFVETLLCIRPINRDVDLLHQTADDLTLFRILNRLNHEYPHIRLTWRDITEHRTINSLAQLLRTHTDERNVPTIAPKTEFLTASPSQRYQIIETSLVQAIGNMLDLSVQEISKEWSITQVDRHQLYMSLAWAFKRDFDFPLYPQELAADATVRGLVEYLTHELEIQLGLGQQPAHHPTFQKGPATEQPKRHSAKHQSGQQVKKVVLILSAPRSGSTLLRLMLAGHSQLFCPPELNLLKQTTLTDWIYNRLKRFPRESRVIQNLMALMGFTMAECEMILDDPSQYKIPIADLYKRISKHSGKPILVDKTPSYAKDWQTLQHAEELFDDARYIHLVRHPFAMIDSFVRHRFHKLLGDPGCDPHLYAERVWQERNDHLLRLAQRIDTKRYHRVYYEQLVQEPVQTMSALCGFLQIPFEEATLRPYDGCRLISGPGDYDVFQHQEIEPVLSKTWQLVNLPYPLQTSTLELATYFGYEAALIAQGE